MSTTIRDFETLTQSLSTIVEKMEKGDLSLEESLKSFEDGIKCIRQCQALLKKAEQRVQIYHKNSEQLQNFHEEE